MTETRTRIAALSAHARLVPAAERMALAGALRQALDGTALVLETCHRVDAFATGDLADALAVVAHPGPVRLLHDLAAVRHAVAVAVGRDSVVVGEDQILHQLRVSVDAARSAGRLDPVLERLFGSALRAGRRARSWSQRPDRSLANVAVAAIEQRTGAVRGRPVLVVGAGRMGGLVVRALVQAGAHVTVSSRSIERASSVASAVNAAVSPLDPGTTIGRYERVIVALGGGWALSAASEDVLVAGPAVVVDLSVPAAIRDGLASRLGSRLITADELAVSAAASAADERLTTRLDALIDATTAEFAAWLDGDRARATAAHLAHHADLVRADALAALWRELPELEPEARAAIEAMTRHFAERLLREPLERLGRDHDGRMERAVREVFAL